METKKFISNLIYFKKNNTSNIEEKVLDIIILQNCFLSILKQNSIDLTNQNASKIINEFETLKNTISSNKNLKTHLNKK